MLFRIGEDISLWLRQLFLGKDKVKKARELAGFDLCWDGQGADHVKGNPFFPLSFSTRSCNTIPLFLIVGDV